MLFLDVHASSSANVMSFWNTNCKLNSDKVAIINIQLSISIRFKYHDRHDNAIFIITSSVFFLNPNLSLPSIFVNFRQGV